jgi:predicted aldo/keto reductase-like oxidoreductase
MKNSIIKSALKKDCFMKKERSSRGRSHESIQRRDFIKQAGFSTLGGSLSLGLADYLFAQQTPAPAAPAYEKRNQLPGMTYVPLGRTNLMVSRLTLGSTTNPWPALVARKAISLGVNLVHCANGYGTMKDLQASLENDWDKFWFALKQETGREKVMAECLDKCLQTIKKDHVDIILPTVNVASKTDYGKLQQDFEKLKKAGKVRFLGATVHAGGKDLPEICKDITDSGIFDIILTMYQPDNKPALDKVLVRAIEKNIGVMSMKTIQGAKDQEDQNKIIQAALSDGAIHTVLKGFSEMSMLNAFAEIAGKTPMPAKPKLTQGPGCLDSGICGGCGNCAECPQGIAIPEIMRCATYYAPQGWNSCAAQTYRGLSPRQTVLSCIDCGLCERQCPRSLAIRETLRRAHQRWA